MTTTDTIYTRHERALMTVGHASDVVRFSLRLALEELAATQSGDDATIAELGSANLRIMELAADLERLQTAANAEVAELRQQIAQMDADNAAMIRRNKELADELKSARLDAALAAFERDPDSVLFGPVGEAAENLVRSAAISATITDHPNGTAVSIQPAHAQSAISNQQSPINNSLWSDPNILTTLDDEATDWWIGVAAGRHTWRTVPKPVQLRMVRHVLSFGPETGAMKMTDFDAIKPDWMPGSGSHTKTLGLSWQQLNDWSVEL